MPSPVLPRSSTSVEGVQVEGVNDLPSGSNVSLEPGEVGSNVGTDAVSTSAATSQVDSISGAVSSVTLCSSAADDRNLSASVVSSVRFVPRCDPPFSKKAKTSPVWQYFQHFDLNYHPDKKCYRLCLICRVKGIDKAVSVGQSASPGPLINHLRTHQEQYLEFTQKKIEIEAATKSVAASTQLSISSFARNISSAKVEFKRKFAQWVVEQSMPLNVGESPTFIRMIKALGSQLVVPDHNSTKDLLYSKKVETTSKLRSYLKSKFYSITCDHWTSYAHENYGALTLHLIDNFVLKTFVLSCVKHPNGTTAPEVEAQLVVDLTSWGLEKGRFIAAVTDTASNMNAFGVSISSWREAVFLRHHYCADHVLQLTAVKAYSGEVDQSIIRHVGEDDEGEDTSISSVKKARALVSFFHSSCIATEKLSQAQKRLNPAGTPLKLVQDVKTRWWSTHDLIERILEVREALEAVFADEFRFRDSQNVPTQLEKLKLTESDYDSLKNVEFVLNPLRKAQKALEGEKYVNISLLPLVINEVRSQLGLCEGAVDQDTQQDLYQLLCVMVDDFKDRWGESMHYSNEVVRASRRRQVGIPTYSFWATALDPRTKKKLSKLLNAEDLTQLWLDLYEAVKHFTELQEVEEQQQQQQQNEEEQRRRQQQQQQEQLDRARITTCNNNFLANSDDDEEYVNEHALTIDEILEAEFKAYKGDRGQPMFSTGGAYNNPLDWWRVNCDKYPNICSLATCILAIPATSAPSERVFSSAANIVNKKRVRLKPDTVDLLIFLRGNKDFVDWD
jgi:hypothetical protein